MEKADVRGDDASLTLINTTGGNTNTEKALLQQLRRHSIDSKESRPHHGSLRRASVMVLLTQDDKILLTKRSSRLRSHPGEVCFPGGKRDPEDADDIQTALRETREEVGLDFFSTTSTTTTTRSGEGKNNVSSSSDDRPYPLEALCSMRTLESINHLCVTPIVMYTTQTSAALSKHLKLNPSEVDAAFWTPLKFFKEATPVEQYDIPWSGETFVYRKYLFQEGKDEQQKQREFSITGLTAHIAHEVAILAFSANDDDDEEDAIGDGNHRSSAGVISSTIRQQQGYLWKWHDQTARRPYWKQQYFVLTNDGILHQYDNEHQADWKGQSANKKNRLRIDDSTKVVQLQSHKEGKEGEAKDFKHCFTIEILDGRIIWRLGATAPDEREEWTTRILAAIPKKTSA